MSAFSLALVAQRLDAAGLLIEVYPDLPDAATDITDDSRQVTTGSLFVAVRGTHSDGHLFLEAALKKGAVAAIVEEMGPEGLPVLLVRDARRAAAIAAAAAFGDPAESLRIVGVTGTNGKTTTVGIMRHLLEDSASMGTLGVLTKDGLLPGWSGLTTPGPIELQRVLRLLVDRGVRHLAMEVSSHSLHQQRVAGLNFHVGVFTNLTRDHLDYHGTLEAYFAAKALLLEQIDASGFALCNADDPAWAALPGGPHLSYGVDNPADFRATDVHYGARGCGFRMEWQNHVATVTVPLIGRFNVSNALAAASATCLMGVPLADVAARLASLPQVPGRLEILAESPCVVRDYAHTPDALERALAAVRPFTEKRIILVFGCGGDRDKGKRPLMAAAGEAGADVLILTSDNPRTEDPEAILDDIQAGLRAGRAFERIEDRHAAIARALELAEPGDVVVLAGKGHEDYQIRGTVKLPFDEAVIVADLTRR